MLLNKLLPVFALPLGIALLLLIFAVWKQRRWPAVVAALLLYVSSIGAVSSRLIGWMETRFPVLTPDKAPVADVIVVLSGFQGPPTPAGQLPNWSDAVDRVEGGLALWRAKAAPRLVFTGGQNSAGARTRSDGELGRAAAIERGLPDDAIFLTRDVANTAEEAAAVAELARRHGWRRIILVTTGWHLPRALAQFRRQGLDCVPFPVDFRAEPGRGIRFLDFVPRAESLWETETALRECYGYVFYRLFG